MNKLDSFNKDKVKCKKCKKYYDESGYRLVDPLCSVCLENWFSQPDFLRGEETISFEDWCKER
jgi:hypothetical protein